MSLYTPSKRKQVLQHQVPLKKWWSKDQTGKRSNFIITFFSCWMQKLNRYVALRICSFVFKKRKCFSGKNNTTKRYHCRYVNEVCRIRAKSWPLTHVTRVNLFITPWWHALRHLILNKKIKINKIKNTTSVLSLEHSEIECKTTQHCWTKT